MATKSKTGLNVNIPEFLYDELVKIIEDDGRNATIMESAREVNRAVLFYVVNHDKDTTMGEELRNFKEVIKNSFYSLAYLISKNFAYELIKDSKGTKYERKMSELESIARDCATDALSMLLSMSDEEDGEREQDLKIKLHNFMHPSKGYKGNE